MEYTEPEKKVRLMDGAEKEEKSKEIIINPLYKGGGSGGIGMEYTEQEEKTKQMDGAEEEEKEKESELYMYDSEESETDEDDDSWSSCSFEDQYSQKNFDSRFFDSIVEDKKDLFVKMMKHLGRYPGVELKLTVNPEELIFFSDARNCLQAVLDGETAGLLELDVNAVPYFTYPDNLRIPLLHKAATCQAIQIAEVCLPRYEAQVNLRVDVGSMKRALPLHLALRHFLWLVERHSEILECISEPNPTEPQQQVYKLIFRQAQCYACPAADIVRFLAPKTAELESEFSKYLKRRELPKLTAILMLARGSLLPYLPKIQDFVFNETQALKRSSIFSPGCFDVDSDTEMFEWAQKKKMDMEAILFLLELFNGIGDKIEAYLQQTKYNCQGTSKLDLVRGLARLLMDEAGFDAEREISNIFDKDTPKNNRVKEPSIESEELSTYGWVHNQDLKTTLNHKPTRNSPLGSSHTYNFVSGGRGFCSASNKCGFSRYPYQFFGASGGMSSTTADKVDKVDGWQLPLQLKKRYQDSNGKLSARQIASVCSWASYLQFKRECILSANSSRWILWITNKLDRALG